MSQRLGGRYLLTRAVASGGMATVWEADDEVLGRRVAVKILHPHLAEDPSFLSRFRAEARAAARLSQSSIVAIYDTVSEPGVEAIVMELVDGVTLRAFLDTYGALPVPDAVALLAQVAGALAAAHDALLVHRDIKPANILLCADRRVKVTDFGIAKALEDDDSTTQGALLGTAKYLAPEQVAGEPVDARADIYSLGVVLYETLTGSVPFDEDTAAATALARLLRQPVDPRVLRPDLGDAIADVVFRCLERRPEDRFPDVESLRAAMTHAAALDLRAPLPPTSSGFDETEVLPSPVVGGAAVSTPEPASTPDDEDEPPGEGLRLALVALVVLGSLALGLGLILATTAGQDLFERIRDRIGGGDEPGASDGGASRLPDPSEVSGDSGAGSGVPRAVGSSAVEITAVRDFDPGGDGDEHPELTRLTVDGNPVTSWYSERYDSRSFGNLKEGVGLIVELSSEQPLRSLTVDSSTTGWRAEIHVSSGDHDELDGWGDVVDARSDIEGGTRFDLRGIVGDHVLVWITDLGTGGRPRVEIGELVLD